VSSEKAARSPAELDEHLNLVGLRLRSSDLFLAIELLKHRPPLAAS
jgi:hypothetical protein